MELRINGKLFLKVVIIADGQLLTLLGVFCKKIETTETQIGIFSQQHVISIS